jgi:nucleotide-binding universal stress UspA family protein
MFGRIVAAWDGSAVAVRAFEVAVGLARRDGSELTVVSIANSPAHAETAGDREESAEAARRYLRETFAAARDLAERAGVDPEHIVIDGDDPTDALLDHVHGHAVDLLVVGHHRSGRAGRLLLRGVPARLIERSEVPVLVVTEPDR